MRSLIENIGKLPLYVKQDIPHDVVGLQVLDGWDILGQGVSVFKGILRGLIFFESLKIKGILAVSFFWPVSNFSIKRALVPPDIPSLYNIGIYQARYGTGGKRRELGIHDAR